MNKFIELTTDVDTRLASFMETKWRPFLSKKEKRAIFVEKSARLLEEIFYEICTEANILQFVECGAYDAFASRKFKSRFSDIKAIAFEANPHVYGNFINLMQASGVKYVNKAVSNKVGTQELIIKSKDTKSWSSEGYLSFDDEENPNLEKIDIKTTTLDLEMVNSLSELPTALWIDIEGSNKVLIEGAESFLKSNLIEVILIETQVDLVWKWDFDPFELCQELSLYGFEPIARDCPGHWGCNIIFVNQRLLFETISLKSKYLQQLELIQLPYFPDIQYRTVLSKLKRMLLRSSSPKNQEHFHKMFSLFGSKSSRDKFGDSLEK